MRPHLWFRYGLPFNKAKVLCRTIEERNQMIKFAPDAPNLLDPSSFSLLGEVSMTAEPLLPFLPFLTNSLFVAAIVLILMLWAAHKATKKVERIPSGFQNFFEFIVEFLYDQVEQIVGPKVAPKCFGLLATIFIYVTVANLFGLLPGVGTIGFEDSSGHFKPILRPATADVNQTLGMALCFMLLWFYLTIKETGVWGFIKHTFAAPPDVIGTMRFVLAPIFMFVGCIEIISITLRPVSLSLRLFGNVFAGENLLHLMGSLGGDFFKNEAIQFICAIVLPLPFYFMEILVGVLQAMVFALLCAVYIQLSTSHEEEGH
ncbi:MAG: F0F1 ATP synthase subunit A [Verrucomicrobiales bacterium]|nr:F0F1 ATP synthase subunit A [Verrucomicrobiales bacterium]